MQYLATITIALGVSVVIFSFAWLLSLKFSKAWIADIAWSLGFFITFISVYLVNGASGFKHNLLLILLIVWGARLAIHLVIRNLKKEDFRYLKLKEKWGQKWRLKSYINIFILQAILLIVINIGPIISTVGSNNIQIGLIDYLAITIWLIGFLFESIGDLQMLIFKRNPNNQGKIYTKGLWKYTRHPNYFGETLMWFSIALIVLPLPYGYIALISPIIITFILYRITGVKEIEKRYKDNPEYIEYIKTTPAYIPNLKKMIQNFKTLV